MSDFICSQIRRFSGYCPTFVDGCEEPNMDLCHGTDVLKAPCDDWVCRSSEAPSAAAASTDPVVLGFLIFFGVVLVGVAVAIGYLIWGRPGCCAAGYFELRGRFGQGRGCCCCAVGGAEAGSRSPHY